MHVGAPDKRSRRIAGVAGGYLDSDVKLIKLAAAALVAAG